MERSEHSSLHGSKAVFTFVQPTEKLKITYREQQNRLRMAVARHKDLQDGCLLDTLEKGGQFEVAFLLLPSLWRGNSRLPFFVYETRKRMYFFAFATRDLRSEKSAARRAVTLKYENVHCSSRPVTCLS